MSNLWLQFIYHVREAFFVSTGSAALICEEEQIPFHSIAMTSDANAKIP